MGGSFDLPTKVEIKPEFEIFFTSSCHEAGRTLPTPPKKKNPQQPPLQIGKSENALLLNFKHKIRKYKLNFSKGRSRVLASLYKINQLHLEVFNSKTNKLLSIKSPKDKSKQQ